MWASGTAGTVHWWSLGEIWVCLLIGRHTHTHTQKDTHTHIDRQELKVNVMTSLTGLLTRRFLQRTLRNKKGEEVINLVSVALKRFARQCVRRWKLIIPKQISVSVCALRTQRDLTQAKLCHPRGALNDRGGEGLERWMDKRGQVHRYWLYMTNNRAVIGCRTAC